MLFAYNRNKELISAKYYSPNENYYCPDCGDQLIFKQGVIKTPHFAHRKKTDCEGLSEGETQEHLQLKQLFWLSGRSFGENWQLEKPLPELNQRPDLLFKGTAVEIQCSTLKISRLIQRFQGYQTGGYKDWWLLGPNLWPKKNWSTLHKHFCSYNVNNGVHIWLIDSKGIYLRSHIHRVNQQYCSVDRMIPFHSLPLLKVYESAGKNKPSLNANYQHIQSKKQFLAMRLVSLDATIKPLQQFLYMQRQHILQLPDWMYCPSQYSLIYNDACIIFRYLYSQNPDRPTSVFQYFDQFCLSNNIGWYFPRIKKEEILQGLLVETRRLFLQYSQNS
ncbi:competence protein CoiA [Enterococcus sp. AZ109]|uniref:competence protein CoiA n=1 Tax=Enterococcus sp. AZ109 TaxID=2774634 RepID=UPI003F21EFC1